MHTTSIEEMGESPAEPLMIDFLHHGDYSGDVVIVLPTSDLIEYFDGRPRVTVPFRTLKEFVGRSLIDAQVSRLEDYSGVEYLDAR